MSNQERPDASEHTLDPDDLDRLCDRIRALASMHPTAGAVVSIVIEHLERGDDDLAARALTTFQFCRESPALALVLACVTQLPEPADDADDADV